MEPIEIFFYAAYQVTACLGVVRGRDQDRLPYWLVENRNATATRGALINNACRY